MAFAQSRASVGATIPAGRPAARRARNTRCSYPPVASRAIRCGPIACNRRTISATPAPVFFPAPPSWAPPARAAPAPTGPRPPPPAHGPGDSGIRILRGPRLVSPLRGTRGAARFRDLDLDAPLALPPVDPDVAISFHGPP